MKIGDMVLVIDSYGGGQFTIGKVLKFVELATEKTYPHPLSKGCPHSVRTESGGAVWVLAVPLTGLMKALS